MKPNTTTQKSTELGKSEGGLKVHSDIPFIVGLAMLGGFYVVMIILMVLADLHFTDTSSLKQTLERREIQHSIKLSLISCTVSTMLSLWVSVPIGYLMSRFQFRFKAVVDTILDIPIVLLLL